MLKSIALSTLFIASMSASAVELQLVDTQSGVFVKATDQSQPVSGLNVNVTNIPQLSESSFTTDERGRVFIPLTLNSSRSVQVEASDMGQPIASTTIFHSSSNN